MLLTKTKESQKMGRLIVIGTGVTPHEGRDHFPSGKNPHDRVNFLVSSGNDKILSYPDRRQGPVASAINLIVCFK